eukprot:scaffold57280_cov61-Phaeocystis_antarctica.AAC.1
MRSPAANSASINPAASPQSFPHVVPNPSCPSRAATPPGVCAAEPSRASLAGPNAPSTTPCRSIVVLPGRPTEGSGPRIFARRSLSDAQARNARPKLVGGCMPPLTAAAVQAILTGDTGAEGHLGQFSNYVLRDCKVVSCEPRRLVVTLPVTARITNSSTNLHGGASCTLVDTLSAPCQLADALHAHRTRAQACVSTVPGSHRCVADRRLQDVRDHRPACHLRVCCTARQHAGSREYCGAGGEIDAVHLLPHLHTK